MSDKIKIRAVIFLAICALVLGVLILSKSRSTKQKEVSKSTTVIIDSEFSLDEQALLHPPGPGASKTEVDEHNQLAAKLAVTGNELEVSNCKSKPLVLQSSQTPTVRMKNSGKLDLSISFDGKKSLKIPTGKSVEINSEFVHGPGLYGYLCEQTGFKGLVGFVLVTP
ncbi:MAG: hypothetical protein WAX44_00045 [Minisyncoccia bacterium]